MLAGRDSAYAPNDAQLAAFYAQGVRVYGGYIKLGNDGIYIGWTKADFDRLRAHGMIPVAYMSGWDDPAQARAVATSWGVSIVIVDIESGIRPDGTWVQGWLNTAQAGEYGNLPVHHYTATIHEDAGYFGYDPRATWPPGVARPAGVCAWQWQGSHSENGITVDSAWWDDSVTGLYGGAGNSITGEEPMYFVGPFHPLSASLKAYAAGNYYAEPFAIARVAGGVTVGAVYAVDGYRFSNSPVQSPNLGNGQPGPDSVFWHAVNGGWVPDAILVTIGLAGAPGPNFPVAEPIAALFDPASGRYFGAGTAGAPDDDSTLATKADLAALALKIPTKVTATLS